MDFYPFSSIIHTLPLILITPSDMEIFTIFIFLSSLPFFSSRFETWKGKAVDFPIKRYFSIRKTVLARRSHTSRNSSNKLDFLQFNFMANTFYWLGEFFRLLVIRKFPFFPFQLFTFNQNVSFNGFSNFPYFSIKHFHTNRSFFLYFISSRTNRERRLKFPQICTKQLNGFSSSSPFHLTPSSVFWNGSPMWREWWMYSYNNFNSLTFIFALFTSRRTS